MKRQRDRTGPLRLILQASNRHDEPSGIRAAPPFLPAEVWRLPGETVDQLAHRALQMAVGSGTVVAAFIYPATLVR